MYKLIVFDLDGTLLDTLDDLTAAVNAALKGAGLPLRTREEVRTFIGNGIVKLMERAVGAPRTDFDKMMQAFREYYALHCQDKTRIYDGVEEMLSALKKTGVKLAVLSNKADFATKKLVQSYFADVFDSAIGENESAGIAKKPSPTALFALMEKWGVTQAETLYVGDSEVDIQTAKNAGVRCLSVAWGFKDEAFLRENGATDVVHMPKQAYAHMTR